MNVRIFREAFILDIRIYVVFSKVLYCKLSVWQYAKKNNFQILLSFCKLVGSTNLRVSCNRKFKFRPWSYIVQLYFILKSYSKDTRTLTT